MPTIREIIDLLESASTIAFSSLPADMQDIIGQFVEDREDALFEEVPEKLPVVGIRVDMIDHVDLDDENDDYTDDQIERYKAGEDFGVDRGQLHARLMDLSKTPPVIIANGWFLDGRHRLWQARRTGHETLPAIDLTGICSPSEIGMARVPPQAIVH